MWSCVDDLAVILDKLLTNISDSNSCRVLVSKGDVFNNSMVQQCQELELLFSTDQTLAAPEYVVVCIYYA